MRVGSAAMTGYGGEYVAPAGQYIAPAGQIAGGDTPITNVPAGNPCRNGETPNSCYARLMREGQSAEAARNSASTASVLHTVESLFGRTAGSIDAAIASGNAIEIERIRQQAAMSIRETERLIAQSTDRTQAAVLQERLNALQMVQQLTSQNSISGKTALYVAGGVAVVALVGLGYMALRPRKNPVVSRRGKKRFVSAAKLRKRARRSRR